MSARDLLFGDGVIVVLENYGLWYNQRESLGLDFPKKAAFVQMQGGSVKISRLDDEVGAAIQGELLQLSESHWQHAAMINGFYVRRQSLSECGESIFVGKSKALSLLRQGEMWIDAKLREYYKRSDAERKAYLANAIKMIQKARNAA